LKDNKIEPTDKIYWTVVLCVLNAFGLLLYILIGPIEFKIEETDEYLSEQELKKAFNEGRR
jgi:hypothetical protein